MFSPSGNELSAVGLVLPVLPSARKWHQSVLACGAGCSSTATPAHASGLLRHHCPCSGRGQRNDLLCPTELLALCSRLFSSSGIYPTGREINNFFFSFFWCCCKSFLVVQKGGGNCNVASQNASSNSSLMLLFIAAEFCLTVLMWSIFLVSVPNPDVQTPHYVSNVSLSWRGPWGKTFRHFQGPEGRQVIVEII